MLSVEEAEKRILDSIHVLNDVEVSLLDALGLTLAEDIIANFDVPPHSNSAMDGYAVRAEDIVGASKDKPIRLQVISNVPAGYLADRAVQPGTAIRIMTGAPLPEGADTVVQVELTQTEGDKVLVKASLPRGRNVRLAGEDIKSGQKVLSSGEIISAADIGVLASLGRKTVRCIRRPKVAILATGDEVVEPGEVLPPGKIYNSNSYAVAAQVKEAGGIPVLLGIARDTRESLANKLQEALALQVDLIVSSGGVSVGDFDLVKDMLTAEGSMEFWQVNMKPGKPLAFGHVRGVPMLGLPGNPVSSMISFELFGRPSIKKMMQQYPEERTMVTAFMEEGYKKTDDRRHFVRVKLHRSNGKFFARLTGEQGSGILTSLMHADGIAIVPEDKPALEPGDEVKVMLIR